MNGSKMAHEITETSPYRGVARLYGIFFLLAFLSYGLGSGLVSTIADGSEGLAGIAGKKTSYTFGIILMVIIHSFVNIGLAVLMLPILSKYNKTITYGYFSLAISATITAVVGAIFMALLLPLSEAAVAMGAAGPNMEILASVLKKGGFYGYQIGMTLWGLGGLMLVYVLYVSQLVPRVLPVWGAVGYLVFMAGTTLELFGYGVGVTLSLPGGLFEIALSLWLIFKGFSIPKTVEA